MVPLAAASSSTPTLPPIKVARSPRRALPSGRSVTSTAITSIEKRPASGDGLPGMVALAGAGRARIPVCIADGHDRESGGACRGERGAVADAIALLEMAHLDDAALDLNHRPHRVLVAGRRVYPKEGGARAHQVAVHGA